MFKKAIFVAGLAIGFVAGSAAGREPFDQIKSQVLGVTNDPEVRRKVSEAPLPPDSVIKIGRTEIELRRGPR